MQKIRLKISYDGRFFSGWQKQKDTTNTVQGLIEDAIGIFINAELKKQNILQAPEIILHSASRTDAGVSAREQYISFDFPPGIDFKRFIRALNGLTPKEITILKAENVESNFSARFTPHVKQYNYRISTRRIPYLPCWDIGSEIDFQSMIKGAQLLVGKHDFRGFRTSDCSAKSTIRTIQLSDLTRVEDDIFFYTIRGNGFLKQMVRIIVGYLVQIGRGNLTLNDLEKTLISGERPQKVETAPAPPLTLEWIDYSLDPF